MKIPNKMDIEEAYSNIRNQINRTPVLTSTYINKISSAELFFKCENFQKVGAFKFRGAINSVNNLSQEQKKNGVATHSSGNHAQALALAAKMNSIPAHIVMPRTAPEVKVNAVKDYGANVIFCEPTLEARESTLKDIIAKTSAVEIHPYDYFNTVCGQGTSSLEFLQDHPDLDIIMTPVGGGGLLSGTATYVKGFNENIKVYAAEPEGADDAYRSFHKKELIPSVNPKTICDGLLTSLGELNFQIILKKVDNIFTVNDDEIKNALILIWERMKIIVEPSCATVLAVVLKYPENFRNKKVGLIISGGNVDIKKVCEYL